MVAYRRVYDSRHLQADCKEPGSAPNPTLGNRVWASFFVLTSVTSRRSLGLELGLWLVTEVWTFRY